MLPITNTELLALPEPLLWLVGFLMVGGALLSFFAALGLLRFSDVLSRVHAATKPQVLGLLLLLVAVALSAADSSWLPLLVLAWLLQLLTVPVSAHMVGRAVYHTGALNQSTIIRDELSAAIDTQIAQLRADDDTNAAPPASHQEPLLFGVDPSAGVFFRAADTGADRTAATLEELPAELAAEIQHWEADQLGGAEDNPAGVTPVVAESLTARYDALAQRIREAGVVIDQTPAWWEEAAANDDGTAPVCGEPADADRNPADAD